MDLESRKTAKVSPFEFERNCPDQPVPEEEEEQQIRLMKLRATQTLCLVLIQISLTLAVCGFATFTRTGLIIFHDYYFLVLPVVIALAVGIGLYLLIKKKKNIEFPRTFFLLIFITLLVSAGLGVASTFTHPKLALSINVTTFLISLLVMLTVCFSSFSYNYVVSAVLNLALIIGLVALCYFYFKTSFIELFFMAVLLVSYSVYLMIDIDQLYFRKVGTSEYDSMKSLNYVFLNATYIYVDYVYLLAQLLVIAAFATRKK